MLHSCDWCSVLHVPRRLRGQASIITSAFLNADIHDDDIVLVTPPPILVKMNIVKPNTVWHVKKAMYGLREAPRLWQQETETRNFVIWSSSIKTSLLILSKATSSKPMVHCRRPQRVHSRDSTTWSLHGKRWMDCPLAWPSCSRLCGCLRWWSVDCRPEISQWLYDSKQFESSRDLENECSRRLVQSSTITQIKKYLSIYPAIVGCLIGLHFAPDQTLLDGQQVEQQVWSLMTPDTCFIRVKHMCQYLHHTLSYALRYVPIPPQSKQKLWVLGDASFAPTGEKSQQGIVVYHGITSIMVSPPVRGKVVTLFNGDLADKVWLPSPLVKQSWLPQVKLFSKERTYPLWFQRWSMQVVTLKYPATMQQHSIWSGMDQTTAWRTRRISDQALWLHQMSRRDQGSHINLPPKMAADSLTKGLGASRLPQIKEDLCLYVVSSNIICLVSWVPWFQTISMYIVFLLMWHTKLVTMFGWFDSIVYEETSTAWHCGVIVLQEQIMSACSAWHCGAVASETRHRCPSWECSIFQTSLRPTLWSAWVGVSISMGFSSMA